MAPRAGTSILWDVDGTLFDTYPAFVEASLRALLESGVAVSPPAAEIDALARVGLGHCLRELASRFDLDADALGGRFDAAYRAIGSSRQRPFPGVSGVCEAILRGGGVNAIATHRARASTEALLDEHGLEHFFTAIVSVEDGYPRKPDPAMFLALLEELDLEPARCLAVGDRDIDVLAGRAAGMRTCLFGGRGGAASRPDLAIADYAELVRFLDAPPP